MSAKTKKRNETTIFLVSLLGILILVNILSIRFFFRGDLTEDGLFTLSRASISVVESLSDKLVVKAYFTKNLPGRYATLERHVSDMLEEYAQHSNGNMAVAFIDPAGDEEQEKIAKSLGIQKMPNPDIEKDQATVKEGYRGISFSYGENTEVIAAVESPVGLEYQITSVLKKISGQRATLGFLVGHGEPEITPEQNPNQQQMMRQDPRSQGEYRNIRHNLDIYNYRQIDFKKGEPTLPSDIKALVIGGAREDFDQKELYEIDQFLMRGGSLAVFIDGVTIDVQQGQLPGMPPEYNTKVNETNLKNFLKHHGILVADTLVMDTQAANFGARCPPIPLPLPRPYPAWPLITAFGEDHPVTYRLGSLTLPYASPVRLSDAVRKESDKEAREISFSSGNAWVVDAATAVVDPCSITPSSNLESSVPMAAAVSGTFTSYFKGKPLPAVVDKKDATDLNAPQEGQFLEQGRTPGRIIAVGSSGLPRDDKISYLARMDRRQALNNFSFVQNALDWLVSEDDLIAVRMKTVADPPLEKTSEGVKAAAKYGNIIGIPFAFILFGLIRWRIRRSRSGR
ncbi:MAG: GldG family protein [Myxococcota bacterium]|nr:GldG family protein [Myxococcota bacterium]